MTQPPLVEYGLSQRSQPSPAPQRTPLRERAQARKRVAQKVALSWIASLAPVLQQRFLRLAALSLMASMFGVKG